MSNRKTIEKAITKEIFSKISPFGFKLVDRELNQFEIKNNAVKNGFNYYLYNKNTYSLFCKFYIKYIELTQIFLDLIQDTSISDDFESGICIIEDELRILNDEKDIQSLKISTLEEIDHFSNSFLDRINRINEKFWSIHSDPTYQMESFREPPGFWINSSFIDNVALWISTGIKNNNIENIKFGLSRGYEICSIKNTQFHKYNQFMKILNEKINVKGYNIYT